MNQKLRNLVYTAMLMALCCVATLVIKIPTVTGGYLNAGDIVVVLAALLAGPLYGGVAAGFGSGLADVISGYMSYAPGTLVVKGCAAVVAAAQAAVGIVGGLALYFALSKVPQIRDFSEAALAKKQK